MRSFLLNLCLSKTGLIILLQGWSEKSNTTQKKKQDRLQIWHCSPDAGKESWYLQIPPCLPPTSIKKVLWSDRTLCWWEQLWKGDSTIITHQHQIRPIYCIFLWGGGVYSGPLAYALIQCYAWLIPCPHKVGQVYRFQLWRFELHLNYQHI